MQMTTSFLAFDLVVATPLCRREYARIAIQASYGDRAPSLQLDQRADYDYEQEHEHED
jgi:hypothetical protein